MNELIGNGGGGGGLGRRGGMSQRQRMAAAEARSNNRLTGGPSAGRTSGLNTASGRNLGRGGARTRAR